MRSTRHCTDHVKAHGYDLMIERGEVLQPPEIAADWYDRVYLPAVESIRWENLLELEAGSTEGDVFLWVLQRRREHDPQREGNLSRMRRSRRLATKNGASGCGPSVLSDGVRGSAEKARSRPNLGEPAAEPRPGRSAEEESRGDQVSVA